MNNKSVSHSTKYCLKRQEMNKRIFQIKKMKNKKVNKMESVSDKAQLYLFYVTPSVQGKVCLGQVSCRGVQNCGR